MTDTVTPPPESPDPGTADDTRPSAQVPRSRTRRAIVGAALAAAVIVAALGVTGLTGLGGPGPLHRYRYSELRDLADAVNAQAGPIRTRDDCWRTLAGAEGPLRDIAEVDYLRSRVVVRLYSRQYGKVDAGVRRSTEREIEAVLEAHPEFDRDMIVTEASPDGWSPKINCRTSGTRIAGF